MHPSSSSETPEEGAPIGFRRIQWDANRETADERRRARELEDRALRTRELRARWNAPERHAARTPCRDGPWGDALSALERRLETGFLLALIGPRGTGKTQLMVELMKRATENGRSALYRTTTEFLMHLKASYRPDSKASELDVFKAHRRPSLLVLDEFTRRQETDWENQVLFELLNHRYADLTDTLIAANLPRPEFETHLGPSLISRLQETGGIVECDWPGFRG